MQATPTPTDRETEIASILIRAGDKVAQAGDRLLIDRLHQTLDTGGSAALLSVGGTILPLLQSLVIVLPHITTDEIPPAVQAAARTLGAALREQGVALDVLLDEGLALHDRLLRAIGTDLRSGDAILVAAVARISRAILDLERLALLAYQEDPDARHEFDATPGAVSGLADATQFEERLAEEVARARREEQPLALLLFDVDRRGEETSFHRFADALRARIRGMDTGARLWSERFSALLPETDRATAEALVARLRVDLRRAGPPVRFRAAIAIAPHDGHVADALLEQAEDALFQGN